MKRGFTLIELMITVAVIAILAAIAIPSYQSHITKSRRMDAISQLLHAQLKQEQVWLTSSVRKYSDKIADLNLVNNTHYTFSASGDKNTYTLIATAQGSQAKQDAVCSKLEITKSGTKTPPNCW